MIDQLEPHEIGKELAKEYGGARQAEKKDVHHRCPALNTDPGARKACAKIS